MGVLWVKIGLDPHTRNVVTGWFSFGKVTFKQGTRGNKRRVSERLLKVFQLTHSFSEGTDSGRTEVSI